MEQAGLDAEAAKIAGEKEREQCNDYSDDDCGAPSHDLAWYKATAERFSKIIDDLKADNCGTNASNEVLREANEVLHEELSDVQGELARLKEEHASCEPRRKLARLQ